MPTEDFFSNPSAAFFCAKDGGEWKELPTLSEPPKTVAMDCDHDITPSNVSLSFTATVNEELPIDFFRPHTKLPRKTKKATKTLYFEYNKHSLAIKLNPTPQTKRQRRIARKCGLGGIMTPKGEILKFTM